MIKLCSHILAMVTLLVCLGCGSSSQPVAPSEPVPEPVVERRIPNAEVEESDEGLRVVTIYYRHPVLAGLVPQERMIFENDMETNLIKQVVDHLTIAPEDDRGLPIWPASTYVREVFTLDDGTLVVDFSSSFTESVQVSVLEEDFMVYSLVQSLLENFTQYSRVHLLIDGQIRETFLGHVDIEFPLTSRSNPFAIIPEPIDDIIVEDLDDEELPKL